MPRINQLQEDDDGFTPEDTSAFANNDIDDEGGAPPRDNFADEGGDTPSEALQHAREEEDVEIVDEATFKRGGAVDDDEPEVVSDDEPGAVDDFPVDVSAEEMASYSDSVKKRIKQFTSKTKRAERRYNRVVNENTQALEVIRAQQQQLRQMQALIQNGEKQYVTAAQTAARSALESAKADLKQALVDGDADQIAEAQAKMSIAATVATQAQGYQPVTPRVDAEIANLDEGVKQLVAQTHRKAYEPDPAAKRWMSRNQWFDSDTRMRNYAIEFARELENDGVNPIDDAKEYYQEIDAEMRRRFPEKFRGQKMNGNGSNGHRNGSRPPAASGRTSSGTSGKQKLTITSSQARLAEKLGLTLKQYAEAYAKEYPKG